MIKISFSLRAFFVFFIILGALTWFFLDKATDKLSTAFQQSSETVLVDTANLLATSLEHQFRDQVLDTDEISRIFEESYKRKIQAQIYSLYKDAIDLEIYITNRQGIVIYDSTGLHEGENFSAWRDVKLTLEGEYGARSSFRYENKTGKTDEKIMVVAAPIQIEGNIVGVLSVVKPIRPLEQLLATESENLKSYILVGLAIAMLIGYLVSHSFTASISRLVDYANNMASGQRSKQPAFMDTRFDNLATAITHMRDQLDGKEYVEHYIHGLTHELKTPLTAVAAAAELLSEEMPAAEQKRFINNIRASNTRMQALVERMLDLARLENMTTLTEINAFDLADIIEAKIGESDSIIREYDLHIHVDKPEQLIVHGDKLLLQQAISNLVDNALENSPPGGHISISYELQAGRHHVKTINEGRLDDFMIERAFERFFSLHSKNGARKSTGLGLSFVREIMHLHHGEVKLGNIASGVCAEMSWPVKLG
ncbi:two-component system sensor histidine kinase CreC [Amphritea sp.]|uniref:two-component system sensor histidine kinase CreC n=1 Tax=Amphritea sp. TaxID=1872502 RepID=UPI003D100FA3